MTASIVAIDVEGTAYSGKDTGGDSKLTIELAKAIFAHASDRYSRSICRALANKYSDHFA
jgi:hypothetical protein